METRRCSSTSSTFASRSTISPGVDEPASAGQKGSPSCLTADQYRAEVTESRSTHQCGEESGGVVMVDPALHERERSH